MGNDAMGERLVLDASWRAVLGLHGRLRELRGLARLMGGDPNARIRHCAVVLRYALQDLRAVVGETMTKPEDPVEQLRAAAETVARCASRLQPQPGLLDRLGELTAGIEEMAVLLAEQASATARKESTDEPGDAVG